MKFSLSWQRPQPDKSTQAKICKLHEALMRLGNWCPACGRPALSAHIDTVDRNLVTFSFPHGPIDSCSFELPLEVTKGTVMELARGLLTSVHVHRGSIVHSRRRPVDGPDPLKHCRAQHRL